MFLSLYFYMPDLFVTNVVPLVLLITRPSANKVGIILTVTVTVTD